MKLPKTTLLQHSHSLGLTEHFVVCKIDNFELAKKDGRDQGLLAHMQQEEGNLWLLMDRRSNASRLLRSG